ncbi:MAG: RraA family protein [Caldilineaceae bacterium]|nr:RraA family protein [Caldilineaceae bacterium]
MAAAPQPGFIIRRSFSRPAAELVAKFSQFSTANLSDVMGKGNTLDYRIKSIHSPPPRLLGVALTVKARPGDNLMAMKAIELALPGDVVMIAGGFDTNYSVWGGIMSLMAVRQRIAGVVTDGLVRDVEQIRRTGLAVYAAGLTPVGPSKDGKGQIGTTISCGGVIVHPGDIVYGDGDGVVVVPQREAEAVLERAHQRIALEDSWMEQISHGEFSLVDSDEDLRARGCRFIEEE